MLAYVAESSFSVMREFGYEPYTTSVRVNSKHFYGKRKIETENVYADAFRFWFSYPDMFKYNLIEMYFELYGKWAKYGDELRNRVKENIKRENLTLTMTLVVAHHMVIATFSE